MGNLQSNPSSSTQNTEKKYEVFLNFRGVDTRDAFTNYLYEALLRKSIETFRDEERIPKGNEIGPTLLKAIRESKVSVVIFSKEYASSKWCLRELVEIMECKEKNGQTVIPVFYKVDVHDVRRQEGSFKDGFDQLVKTFEQNLEKEQVDSADVEKRKNEFYEEMQSWRQALEVASRVKGWHVEGPESKVIDDIVKDIWETLIKAYKLYPCDFKGLFGFEERCKQVMSLLCLDNTDTRLVGIWGMGGIGKTTIADAIFHQISDNEYCKCFIENVRQRLEQCVRAVSVLQQEILSKVFNDQDIKLQGVTLSERIKRRLREKKVFIVLDDVNNFLKLEKLAAGLDGLGPGSRILITTRNRDILRKCLVSDDYIYEVKGLSYPEAFQLFCEYAQPTEDCLGLSKEIVNSINGNPLGLKVVGSSLLGSNKQEWQSAKRRLNKSSEILEVLQISYNGLEDEDRQTFLDIACFFVREHKDYVTEILDNCSHSLKVLSDRSLVTISNNMTIQMHDLLQEMDREIVCKEDLNSPGNRSRLWTREDVLDTLKNSDGTKAIRGIFLNMVGMNEEHLSSQAFEKIKNLRFLKFYDTSYLWCCSSDTWSYFGSEPHTWTYFGSEPHTWSYFGSERPTWSYFGSEPPTWSYFEYKPCTSNLCFPNGINYLSNKLRSLNWLGYPLKALPSNFIPENLVELNLRHSNIAKLWEDNMRAPKLKWIILKSCSYLNPYLNKVFEGLDAPLLEKIDIECCKNLHGLPLCHFPSRKYHHLKSSNKLTTISECLDAPLVEKIDIECCKSLLGLSSCHFPSLKYLYLKSYNKLTKISDRLDAPLLEIIDIYKCQNLLGFPSPVHHFNNLRELNLRGCKNLQFFPNNIPFPSLISLDLSECINLAKISDLLDAPLLKKINLYHCKSLLDFPPPVHHFNNLCELNLWHCENLKSFPNNIPFPKLVSLDLSGCINLAGISDVLDAPLLETMDLYNCSSLLYFPAPFQHFDNLCNLDLWGCKNLLSFPRNNIYFPSITCLDFRGCVSLTKFPHISGNIKRLYMRMTGIDEVPVSIENLTDLVKLDLAECTRLKHISIGICNLKALSELNLSNCSALECFPEIVDTMGSLKILDLSGTAIKGLHHSIENLSGLEMLFLKECKNLEMLPISIYNLTSLNILYLSGCSKLENLLGNSVADLSNCGESATTKPPSCRLSKCELCFINCLNLNKTAIINIMELRINHCKDMTTKGCATQAVDLKFYYPGSEVPGWFKHQTDGSLINIQMSGHDGVNGHLIGLAACAVIKFYGRGYDFESLTVNINYCHRCHCMGSRRWNSSIKVSYGDETFRDYVALWYSDASVLKLCENGCPNYFFEFSLFNTSPIGRVKYCGICPIYEKHNTTLPSIANETSIAADQDFGETFVKEQGKIRKFSDEAETCGRSNEDVIEPHFKRTCS